VDFYCAQADPENAEAEAGGRKASVKHTERSLKISRAEKPHKDF
jgi:hypothetical protein